MDAADVLYGVCMQDGATKVISRRLPREQRLSRAAGSEDGAGPDERGRLARRVGCAPMPTTWAELLDLGDREVARAAEVPDAEGRRRAPRLLQAPAREPRDEPARRSAPSSARACSRRSTPRPGSGSRRR